jgi:hypothetical protein
MTISTRKFALVATLGLASLGANAGEIAGLFLQADRVENIAGASKGDANQDLGVAVGTGRLVNTQVHANDAKNHGFSRYGIARQSIGVAFGGGTIERVQVHASGAYNGNTAELAFAYQNIGTATNGRVQDSVVIANRAVNKAQADETRATQNLGVAR